MGWESAGPGTVWRDSLCSESPGSPRLGGLLGLPAAGDARAWLLPPGQWAGHKLAQRRDSEESAQVREPTGHARDQAPSCERQEPVQADFLPRDVCMKCFCFYLKGNLYLLPATLGCFTPTGTTSRVHT